MIATLSAILLMASTSFAASPTTPAKGASAAAATPVFRDSMTADSIVTTIFLVRHAEKSITHAGTDVPLSEAGVRRAETLAHVLGDAGITAIYSTHWQRTRETALPIAQKLGDTLRIVDQGDAAAFARRIRAENQGGTALVVGHSDTVPQIVAALVGRAAPAVVSGEYDALYVVTLYHGARPRVVKLRYGEPYPPKP
jgi:broad specificity phosphatase PhoE